MSTVSSAMSSGVNALMLPSLGAELGKMVNFSTMQFALGFISAGAFKPATQPFTATMPSFGKADLDLGDGNKLSIDESGSSVTITDAQGHQTQVWGDPHVNVDGQHVGDFYGTTTFQMNDGTKITIATRPDANNPKVAYADTVTVTRGDQAAVISGVSQQTQGDLKVSLGGDGYAIDAGTRDGLVLNQAAGGGWNSAITGKAVSQSDFDLTYPGQEQALAFGEALSHAIGSFLSFGSLGALMSVFEASASSQAETAKPRAPLAAATALFGVATFTGAESRGG